MWKCRVELVAGAGLCGCGSVESSWWQVQDFVGLGVQISWQAQDFVDLEVQIRGRCSTLWMLNCRKIER